MLVGDGDLRPQVEERIVAHGLHDHVELAGWASAAGVADRLRAARAMVLPSSAEGLPVVVMEALALGRPVVSTFVAGIPELLDGSCGWRVPAGDPAALADALVEVLQADPARLDDMGQVGRARVATRHRASAEAARLRAALAGEPEAPRSSTGTPAAAPAPPGGPAASAGAAAAAPSLSWPRPKPALTGTAASTRGGGGP